LSRSLKKLREPESTRNGRERPCYPHILGGEEGVEEPAQRLPHPPAAPRPRSRRSAGVGVASVPVGLPCLLPSPSSRSRGAWEREGGVDGSRTGKGPSSGWVGEGGGERLCSFLSLVVAGLFCHETQGKDERTQLNVFVPCFVLLQPVRK
jgi:hypothetical protein